MKINRERMLEILLLAGFCAFLFFFRLGALGLLGADEPRYAQVAREMLARHDWVTPILNGQPWLEKPILYYWGAMLSYGLFGVNELAARLPSAVLATLMIVGIYAFMTRFRPSARLDAALMTASSALVLGMARAASTDMPLTAMFTLSLLAWYGWFRTQNRWLLVVFYAANAAAMLAKGPVAPFLAAVVILVFALVMRDWHVALRTLWLPGILVFLAIALPWYVLVQMHTPQFLHVFIFEHNLARFGTNMFRHRQPFWYYVPVVLAATAPWLVLVIAGLASTVRDWKNRVWRAPEAENSLPLFLLLWAVVPVVFFSLSKSKLPAYILPAVPPLLILAADWVHRRAEQETRPVFWLAALHAALLAFLAAAMPLVPGLLLKRSPTPQTLMLASVAGTVVFVGVVLALFTGGWRVLRFATLAPVVLCVGFLLRSLAPIVDATQSTRPIAKFVRELGVSNSEALALYNTKRDLEYGLQFYRDRNVVVYTPLETGQPEMVKIPAAAHMVVVREGAANELRNLPGVAGRAISFVGYYRPQRVEIYSVSAAR